MPTYEYTCKKCHKQFAVTMHMEEHGKKKPKCPKCSSSEVVPNIQPFFATTSKKS